MAGLQTRPAQADDALCLSVLAMQVFLDTRATEGICSPIAREVLSIHSGAAFRQATAAADSRIDAAGGIGHSAGSAQVSFGATLDRDPPAHVFHVTHVPWLEVNDSLTKKVSALELSPATRGCIRSRVRAKRVRDNTPPRPDSRVCQVRMPAKKCAVEVI